MIASDDARARRAHVGQDEHDGGLLGGGGADAERGGRDEGGSSSGAHHRARLVLAVQRSPDTQRQEKKRQGSPKQRLQSPRLNSTSTRG